MAESFAAGLVGVVLDDRYRLDAVLGEGGMGAVFRATHLAMERKVAVKLLKPHLTTDQASLERFAREARSTMKVESPHAVKVLDFGVTPLRDYYMVLEYLDGRTVQRELEIDGPFSPTRTIHIARQALHALGAAHARGLVHRDVKPDNLLLMRVGDDPDYTKVLDFGVAKLMEGAAQSELALTAIGTVFGTPEFMSPEQACGQSLDARSDLYSLAVTMFVMLTGCALFEARNAIECLTHHARTPPPRLDMVRPALSAHPELDELLQRCLAKVRDQRPRDAGEMNELLDRVEAGLARRAGKTTPSTSAAPTSPPIPSLSTGARLTMFNQSSFFEVVTDRASQREIAGSTSDVAAIALPGRRRGLTLIVGAVIILALIGASVGLMAHRRSRTDSVSASIPDAGRASPVSHDAVAATPPADASTRVEVVASDVAVTPDAPDMADAAALDAAVATASRDAGRAVPRPPPPATGDDAFREHLRAAFEARASGNNLRQLSAADAAMKLNPGSALAKYLVADALIKGNDFDRGCKYLAQLRRFPRARELALAARCPSN